MFKLIFLFVFVLPARSFCQQSDPLYKIVETIKEGKIEELTKFMTEPVELGFNDGSYNYNRTQARLVIENFLGRKYNRYVSIINSGEGPDHIRYAILRLTTNNGVYRVLLKWS